MKKIYIIICMALLASGCADLNLYPLDTGSSDSWYKTEAQFRMSIEGLYRPEFWPIDDVLWCDDVQDRDKMNLVTNGTLNSESGEVSDRWANAYKCIARANALLERLEEGKDLEISPSLVDLFRGQVLCARAVQYGILVSYFGDVVYVDKGITIKEAFSYGRTDKDEILEHVYKDFDDAAELLPLSYDGQVELATKGAAYALKARYALWNEDWEIAAKAAKKCMDLNVYELNPDFEKLFLSSTHHDKENILSWPRSVELKDHLHINYTRDRLPRTRTGWAAKYPSWELFCSFLCTDGLPIDESPLFDPHKPFENRDPRCTMTIVPFETMHLGVLYDPNPKTKTVFNSILNKEVNNEDTKSVNQYASYNGLLFRKGIDETWINDETYLVAPDRVFIRFADVLLMYAEAKIEADDIDQTVLDAINKVRARAYKVDYTATGLYPAVTVTDRDELRRIVRTERRMELVEEGWRYKDLIRWRLAEKVLNKADYGLLDAAELESKIVDAGKWFFPYTPEIDDDGIADFDPMYADGLVKKITQRTFDVSKHYLWPIPSKEVITNPNLGQNDNY